MPNPAGFSQSSLAVAMTNEEKEVVRARLRELIVECEENIVGLRKKTEVVAPDIAVGRLSRMDAIQEKEVSVALLREAEARLLELKRVQQLVDSPEYGICQRCGQAIAPARLEARPEATLCIGCA